MKLVANNQTLDSMMRGAVMGCSPSGGGGRGFTTAVLVLEAWCKGALPNHRVRVINPADRRASCVGFHWPWLRPSDRKPVSCGPFNALNVAASDPVTRSWPKDIG